MASICCLRPESVPTAWRRPFRQDGPQRHRVRDHGRDAEGLHILRQANIGKRKPGAADAETTPLQHSEYYQYGLNVADIAEAWCRGSVIGSWLLDLTAKARPKNPELSEFSGRVRADHAVVFADQAAAAHLKES